ncbi:hypothetical protein C8R45DRAFT_947258 [Mycena sanguinolenta]|nr:hypothetical protein C8R45DRAFT_947258 [Mycena sanguinolenta]
MICLPNRILRGGQSSLHHRLPPCPHRTPVDDRLSRRAVRVHSRQHSESRAGCDPPIHKIQWGCQCRGEQQNWLPFYWEVAHAKKFVRLTSVEKIIHLELKRRGTWLGHVWCWYCPMAHQEKYDLQKIGGIPGFIAIVEARLRTMSWLVTRFSYLGQVSERIDTAAFRRDGGSRVAGHSAVSYTEFYTNTDFSAKVNFRWSACRRRRVRGGITVAAATSQVVSEGPTVDCKRVHANADTLGAGWRQWPCGSFLKVLRWTGGDHPGDQRIDERKIPTFLKKSFFGGVHADADALGAGWQQRPRRFFLKVLWWTGEGNGSLSRSGSSNVFNHNYKSSNSKNIFLLKEDIILEHCWQSFWKFTSLPSSALAYPPLLSLQAYLKPLMPLPSQRLQCTQYRNTDGHTSMMCFTNVLPPYHASPMPNAACLAHAAESTAGTLSPVRLAMYKINACVIVRPGVFVSYWLVRKNKQRRGSPDSAEYVVSVQRVGP